jgi:integrase/recombinase XerD
VPAHHLAEAYLDAYLEAAKLDDPKAPLFQSVDRARRLTGQALQRREVLAMIKRRAAAAGLPPSTCCHTFRATGITTYLTNGGTLETRAAECRLCLAEDHEVIRPHAGRYYA